MSDKSNSGGIGFLGLLTIVFITLKLTGHIDWSWWWVWSPVWIAVGIVIVIVAGGLAGAALIDILDRRRNS